MLTKTLLLLVTFLLLKLPQILTRQSLFDAQTTNNQDLTIRRSLVQCISSASTSSFKHHTVIVYILPYTSTEDQTNPALLPKLIITTLTQTLNWSIIIKQPSYSTDLNNQRKRLHRYNVFLLHIRRLADVSKTISALKQITNWNPHGKFLIIAATKFAYPQEAAVAIFQQLFKANIVNGVVFLQNWHNLSIFDAYTWYPFSDNNCGSLSPERIAQVDTCSFGIFSEKTQLFTKKIPWKFNNCRVRVRVVQFPPYVMSFANNTWSYEMKGFQGIEVNLLNLIAQKLNLSMRYYFSKKKYNFGEVLASNNSVTPGSNLEFLYEELDDISIGFHVAVHENTLFFDYIIYLQHSFFWCVPFSLLDTKLKSILEIIKIDVIFIVVILFVAFSLMIWASSSGSLPNEQINSYRNILNCFQNTFLLLLGLPVANLPKNEIIRLFFMALIIYSFFFITAYQTFMTSVLMHSQNKQEIQTLEDIINSNLTCRGSPQTFKYFKAGETNDNESRKVLEQWTTCLNPEKCLERLVAEKNTALIQSDLEILFLHGKFVSHVNNHPLVYCIPKPIAFFFVNILMRKGFPLFENFYTMIQWIDSAGYIVKWVRDLEESKRKTKMKVALRHVFSLADLKPFFVLLGIGSGVSVVVFVLEIVCFKLNKRAKN